MQVHPLKVHSNVIDGTFLHDHLSTAVVHSVSRGNPEDGNIKIYQRGLNTPPVEFSTKADVLELISALNRSLDAWEEMATETQEVAA